MGNVQRAFWTDWQIGIHGGATIASSAITQAEGFCGTGGPTAPPGCTTTSSTTTHDTVVGQYVGVHIAHPVFSHVGVFVEYDSTCTQMMSSQVWFFLLDDTKRSRAQRG